MRPAPLRSLALGVLLVALLGSVAAAKPKVAILGLEVVGNLDPDQTRLAKQLTIGLRDRASAGTGPFVLAPNSNKELVDEKLMNNCGSEALACMTPIAIALQADFLMFGKIEKVDRGFHLTIKLIRVANKMPMPTFSEIIPITEIRTDPKGVAKRAYARVTASDEGTVTIRVTNVDRATVYIDDEPKGTTSSGVLALSVPIGKRKVAVVATEKGWRRFEETLDINAGDSRNIPVELARVKKGEREPELHPPGSELSHTIEGAASDTGNNTWKNRAIGGVILTAIATGVFGASWGLVSRNHKAGFLDYDCMANDTSFECRHGQALTITAWSSGIAAIGLAGFSVFSFYKAANASRERPTIGGRSTRPRRELTVTPVVSPTGGGAALRFDW